MGCGSSSNKRDLCVSVGEGGRVRAPRHSRGAGKGSSTRRIGTAELKEREPLSKQRKREAVGFQQTWEPPHSAAFG